MQESIVQSQLNEPISITKNQADHVNGKDSVESAKVVLSSSAANEKGESEMQSDEPSYNKLANCTNHVKVIMNALQLTTSCLIFCIPLKHRGAQRMKRPFQKNMFHLKLTLLAYFLKC